MSKQSQFFLLARQATVLLLAVPLIACGSDFSLTTMNAAPAGAKKHSVSNTTNAAFNAALTPLEDLGIRRQGIPDDLKSLASNPYLVPSKYECDTLKEEVATLDNYLGPDLDYEAVALTANASYADQGSELANDGIVGIVKSQASIIPFRSIVRRITGAERHANEVARAYQAGKLRRAYLKGLAQAKFGQSCMPAKIEIVAEAEQTTDDTSDDEELYTEYAAAEH